MFPVARLPAAHFSGRGYGIVERIHSLRSMQVASCTAHHFKIIDYSSPVHKLSDSSIEIMRDTESKPDEI